MTAQRAIGFGLESLPRIVRGQGSYLFDAAGRRYLDGSGGPAAFCLGHAHPQVNAAITAQLERVACAYRYLFTTDVLEELTRLILTRFGTGFGQVVYSGSGSEAVESALKVALQYWHARGLPSKHRFIARQRSYHGNTLGALSMSGFAERRVPFEQSLLDVSFVSAANSYRPAGNTDESDLTAFLAAELEQRIVDVGPERVAGFIFEPVVGAAGGVVPPPPGYVQAIRTVCDRYDILLIADEVMCGSGRCGTWLALEREGVNADITTVAKGLAGGYIPLGATVFSSSIADAINAAHGSVLTGHTYSGHTAACAAGLAVQHIIESERLLQRVTARGARFQSALRESLDRFDEVGDVRGRGYFIGIELVRDRRSKEPFPATRGLSHAIGRRAFENGLICYPCAGNVGDGRGDTLVLAPPFNATDAELAELLEKLVKSIETELRAP